MDSNGLLNIYEQYYQADLRYGFYLRERTWQSIGRVLFKVGVQEGRKPRGEPPYFNNPKVYVKLFYANSIGEINALTKFRVIKIYDGGTYRYQPVDENFILPSKKSFLAIKRRNNLRKFVIRDNFFRDCLSETEGSQLEKLDDSSS
ncbi:MAG: hypothetical protein R3182_00330 [Draconibacterium sp.]|nr:hypothetical protein [Draconibacterium sp.]